MLEQAREKRIEATYSLQPWRRAQKIAEGQSTRFLCSSPQPAGSINDKPSIVINLDKSMVSAIAAVQLGTSAFSQSEEPGSVERHLARYAAQKIAGVILGVIPSTNFDQGLTKTSHTNAEAVGEVVVSPIDDLNTSAPFNKNDDCITISLTSRNQNNSQLSCMSIIFPLLRFSPCNKNIEASPTSQTINFDLISRHSFQVLRAELTRITVSLKTLISLQPGSDIDLPTASINNIELRPSRCAYPIFSGALVARSGARSIVVNSAINSH